MDVSQKDSCRELLKLLLDVSAENLKKEQESDMEEGEVLTYWL